MTLTLKYKFFQSFLWFLNSAKQDLESSVDIVIRETETKVLLDIPSVCVAMDNVALHTAVYSSFSMIAHVSVVFESGLSNF